MKEEFFFKYVFPVLSTMMRYFGVFKFVTVNLLLQVRHVGCISGQKNYYFFITCYGLHWHTYEVLMVKNYFKGNFVPLSIEIKMFIIV